MQIKYSEFLEAIKYFANRYCGEDGIIGFNNVLQTDDTDFLFSVTVVTLFINKFNYCTCTEEERKYYDIIYEAVMEWKKNRKLIFVDN